VNDTTNQERTGPKTAGAACSSPVGEPEKDRGSAMEGSDSWLIAKVRSEPPEAHALDALVERHWKQLFARCQLLTANPEKASQLAQATCDAGGVRHGCVHVSEVKRTIDAIGETLRRQVLAPSMTRILKA